MSVTTIALAILIIAPVAIIVLLIMDPRTSTPQAVTGQQGHHSFSDSWRDDPITQPQLDFIQELGGHPSRNMTKGEASDLIDSLIEQRNAERQAKYDAERDARQREKQREKEQTELTHLAAAMSDPGYKPRKRRSKRMQDLSDFQHILNDVFADDIITPSEAAKIIDWLFAHKVQSDDFANALDLLPHIVDGSASPEMAESVYASLLDCLRTLRARPTV